MEEELPSHIIRSSSFATYDISKWLSDNVVFVDMHGCPTSVDDVMNFCGDFLAVLCTTCGLSVDSSDDEIHEFMNRNPGARKVGIVVSVNLNIKAAPYADSITKWIESDYTQLRTRAFLLGTAVIVKNKLFREVANHVLTRSKGTAPRKAFESQDEALEWLQTLSSSST